MSRVRGEGSCLNLRGAYAGGGEACDRKVLEGRQMNGSKIRAVSRVVNTPSSEGAILRARAGYAVARKQKRPSCREKRIMSAALEFRETSLTLRDRECFVNRRYTRTTMHPSVAVSRRMGRRCRSS